ncbi:MAG: sulfotransferase [Deltaproteobacteria bacterium]|nr:sulfotransferase [Deltaproteobacteria bacterium]
MELTSLDEESLITEAREKSGLTDFGDESFRRPMRMLLKAMEEEARLNEIGRITQRARIVGLLVNRLRTEDHFKRFPEILEQEIRKPLVIVGLGRTGTTMLQRLIASDPRILSVFWWESRNPAPFPGAGNMADGSRDPRIIDAEAEVSAMIDLAPDLAAIHPIEAEASDEEIMLLEHSFFSTTPEALVHIPSYSMWLEQQDQTAGYEYLKQLLQFLQWQKKRSGVTGERWVLKTPHHLGFLDLLFKVFPDATVIQTHRDPVETIPSWASLVYTLRTLASDSADAKEAGRHWSRKFKNATRHSLQIRDTFPGRFIDIWYRDVLKDPVTQIRQIYEYTGMELTPEVEQTMIKWTIDHARDKRPVHHYTLEEFGLTEEGLKKDFAEYRKRFILNPPVPLKGQNGE